MLYDLPIGQLIIVVLSAGILAGVGFIGVFKLLAGINEVSDEELAKRLGKVEL